MSSRTMIRLALMGVMLAPSLTWACAYTDPNDEALGVDAGDDDLLLMPHGDFVLHADWMLPVRGSAFKAVPPTEGETGLTQTLVAERMQLKAELLEQGTDEAEADSLVEQYIQTRTVWAEFASEPDGEPPVNGTIPAGLPAEFDDYLRGVVAVCQGDRASARRHWERLLKRPEAQRRYRGVFATFMLGRYAPEGDSTAATDWFEWTREMVAAGAPDPIGLANSSYGWQARVTPDPLEAIRLYRLQRDGGDPTAIWSLRLVAQRALNGPVRDLARWARDPSARDLMTAFILSQGDPFLDQPNQEDVTAWIELLEQSGIDEARGGDQLAWMAYVSGRVDLAERWLHLAPKDSPVSMLVQAKLHLRRGEIEPATALLEGAVARFGEDQRWNRPGMYDDVIDPANYARCDLALIRLSQKRYTEALDLYLRSQRTEDVVYLVERILTVDELRAYVRQTWPGYVEPATQPYQSPTGYLTDSPAPWIRHSLARRLARLGRWEEAREFYPASVWPTVEAYLGEIQMGQDSARPAAERAAHLFAAAKAAVEHGPEMLGVDERYSWYTSGGELLGEGPTERQKRQSRLAPTSEDESQRIEASRRELPEPTWHYRYTGAELAWSAAQLLPDNDPLLVDILMTAGDWLKHKDPKRADRFYKSLVRRCRGTPLGREADRLRWFPKRPESRRDE